MSWLANLQSTSWEPCTSTGRFLRMLHHGDPLISLTCKTAQRRQWQPTPVLLPGKSHGRGSLMGCSLWGLEESDTTDRLPFHFSLSCIGEGNGNPLQCSCLENPRDGGAWWAADYGVAESQTRLKRLSSSSSSSKTACCIKAGATSTSSSFCLDTFCVPKHIRDIQ